MDLFTDSMETHKFWTGCEKTLAILAQLNDMIRERLRTRAPKSRWLQIIPTARLSQTLLCGSN